MMSAFGSESIGRRRFLRQTFGFSALAALGTGRILAAPPVEPGSANLLMIGDWGAEDSKAQTRVAAAMRAYAGQYVPHLDALLFLGDNWYGALEGGVKSARWQTQFEEMYPASAFPVPAYAILGNHDYQRIPAGVNKRDAELEYARTAHSRWTMPSRWYRFEFPRKKPLITFLALDSNMPHHDVTSLVSHNFTLTKSEKDEQLAWLEKELRHPRKTPFLVAMGHHPVYSDGPHGDHPTLIHDWDPLFREYKVPVYLAGHDHDLQHLEFEGHPTTFFLSGGGGAGLYTLKIDPEQRGPYAQKIHGFTHLSVTRDLLTLRHIDEDGRTLHAIGKTPEGRVSILS